MCIRDRLYTDVANAAFFTIFYVPMVPIILFFIYSKSIHWSIWPSVIFCVFGVYLLSDFSDATIRLGDGLVILCALFWALHIIFIGNFAKSYDMTLLYGALQALIVSYPKCDCLSTNTKSGSYSSIKL